VRAPNGSVGVRVCSWLAPRGEGVLVANAVVDGGGERDRKNAASCPGESKTLPYFFIQWTPSPKDVG
jgi:hypothetical protein